MCPLLGNNQLRPNSLGGEGGLGGSEPRSAAGSSTKGSDQMAPLISLHIPSHPRPPGAAHPDPPTPQRGPARPRQREMAVQALGELRRLARGCKQWGKGGRAGQGGTESCPVAQGSDD